MVSGVLTIVGDEPRLLLVQFEIQGVSFLSGDDSAGLVSYLSRDGNSPFFGTLFDEDVDLTCHPPVIVRAAADAKGTLKALASALGQEGTFVLCDLSSLAKDAAFALSEKIADRFPSEKILLFAPACFDHFPGIKVDALRPLAPDPEPASGPETAAAISFQNDFGGIGPLPDNQIVPSTARRFAPKKSGTVLEKPAETAPGKPEPIRMDVFFVPVFFLLCAALNLIAYFLSDPKQPLFGVLSFVVAILFQFCASLPVGFAVYDDRSLRSRNVLISYTVHTLFGLAALALSASLLGLAAKGWEPVAFCAMLACFPLTGLTTVLIAKRMSAAKGEKKGKK